MSQTARVSQDETSPWIVWPLQLIDPTHTSKRFLCQICFWMFPRYPPTMLVMHWNMKRALSWLVSRWWCPLTSCVHQSTVKRCGLILRSENAFKWSCAQKSDETTSNNAMHLVNAVSTYYRGLWKLSGQTYCETELLIKAQQTKTFHSIIFVGRG